MQALFLVFLAAAWLNELVLAVGMAPNALVRRACFSIGLVAGGALGLAALAGGAGRSDSDLLSIILGTRGMDYLLAFSFLCVLFQLALGRSHPGPLTGAQRAWRMAMPLLVGTAAVAIQAFATPPPDPASMLAVCIAMTSLLALLTPVATAVLDRLQLASAPMWMRGTPLLALSAAIAAFGFMALVPVLRW